MKPRLIVQQKITAFVNRYEIYNANNDGGAGELVAFAEQKRLAFKEKVSFYSDKEKQNLLFTFRAEKVMDIHGKYFVEDVDGSLVGAFKKDFAQSLINSTWNILDINDQSVLNISENNQFLAVMRRFAGWIPIVGEFVDLFMSFFRYHFVLKTPDGAKVGMYMKTTLFRDHYLLQMTDESYASTDWRVLAAMAVGLDALQSR